METAISSLGYIGLGVSDIAGWREFASSVLGVEVCERADEGLYLRLDEYEYRFAIHPTGEDDLKYVGWEVADAVGLHGIAAKVEKAGHEVALANEQEARERGVVELIHFRDPNGIMTEVFYGPHVTFEKPFNSPRGVQGFVTGGQGLGHIVTIVNDLEESLTFYRDLLGMRISDYVRMEIGPDLHSNIVFLHCNARHHSLGMLAAPAPKRLNHFMLELESLDDVGMAYDLCRERNVPIPGEWGRHTNDHMVSFYMETPSGFNIEYGWGARQVYDDTWKVQLHRKGSIWGHEGIYPTLPT